MSKWGLLASLIVGATAAIGAGTASPGLSAADRAGKAAPAVTQPATAPVGPKSVAASTAPTTAVAGAAASQPKEAWAVPALAGDLTILSSRSMFLHGRPPTAHAGPAAPSAPSLILRGVARQGEQLMALVEDVGAKQTKQLHVGDAIGPGKLVAITTDGVDRMFGGKVSHVRVGQPIEAVAGGAGPGPTTRPSGIAAQGPVDNEPSAANSPPVTATAVVDPAAPAEVSTAGAKLIPGHE